LRRDVEVVFTVFRIGFAPKSARLPPQTFIVNAILHVSMFKGSWHRRKEFKKAASQPDFSIKFLPLYRKASSTNFLLAYAFEFLPAAGGDGV